MSEGLRRLTEPMVREGGRLRPASWEEALIRAAAGFDAARKQGPQAFGMFSCSKTTNEMNFIAQKFTRAVMHSNNVDSCNRT
jgi:formate dehydrogenase major subunit